MADSSGDFASLRKRVLTTMESKKTKNRKEFSDILLKEMEVVDDLLALAQKLGSKGQFTEANKLLRTVDKVIANNKRLQNKVGEVLSDSD